MNNNQKQSSNPSGLGSLAQSLLGGSSNNNKYNNNTNNNSSGGSGGLAGQLIGSFLGGGNKPQNQQNQQYQSQQNYGSNQQGHGSNQYGQQQQHQTSYNQPNQGQISGSGTNLLGKLFGGSSSVCTLDKIFQFVNLTLHSTKTMGIPPTARHSLETTVA